jgi:uncharacterized protein (UPF0333 family)
MIFIFSILLSSFRGGENMFGLRFRIKKGQSTLEYAIVIAVIVAALVVMQLYIRRGVQGRLRQSADDLGEQFAPSVTFNVNTTFDSNVQETIMGSGADTGKISTNYFKDVQRRKGTESVNMQKDTWWPTGK